MKCPKCGSEMRTPGFSAIWEAVIERNVAIVLECTNPKCGHEEKVR